MAEHGRITFRGRIRFWDPVAGTGLAVVDVPIDLVAMLGGRRQMRVEGALNGAPYAGSGMLVAGGGYCVAASRAVLKAAGAAVGDEVELVIRRAG